MTFDDHVRAALDSLPPELARALRNVAVVVEDENPEDPDLFGLYEGVPLPERGDEAGSLPDRIAIYRRPLEEEFPDPRDLEREIRITVLHELGHYFGLDEDRLEELGYE
ncbi:MAG: metallopeptidase family protein [Actinobacteria bacterium]|nr:MAG: metallopeptidase family protein [Actinomycetota bacterium]